jgi:hypothetical protein
MSITLARALKLKNKLAGEIKDLKNKIMSKNVILVGKNTDLEIAVNKYDVHKMYVELNDKKNKLVNLKIIINDANREIIHNIFTISELKDTLKFISSLDTREGLISRGYVESEAQMYFSQIDDNERDLIKKKLQNQIDVIQEEIDQHNHNTKIDVDPKDLE